MLIALLACIVEEKACDTMAAGSVNVTVEGPESPTVTYTHEGVDAACDGMGDGTFVCGWEVAGDITVRAEAEGWVTAEETVTVASDACHVLPESLTIVMEEDVVDCTEEALPSVVVSVAGASGEALTGVAVTWMPADAAVEPSACSGADADWTCGEEEAGDFVVFAVADGHQEASEAVTVAEDECHVITEEVDFLLQWGED